MSESMPRKVPRLSQDESKHFRTFATFPLSPTYLSWSNRRVSDPSKPSNLTFLGPWAPPRPPYLTDPLVTYFKPEAPGSTRPRVFNSYDNRMRDSVEAKAWGVPSWCGVWLRLGRAQADCLLSAGLSSTTRIK